MAIGKKYNLTASELKNQKEVSTGINLEESFHSNCYALIICAYRKTLAEKKIIRNWKEVPITRNLKVHLRTCAREQELPYFIVPEYPEDDPDIDAGLKNPKTEVYFDLVFGSFYNPEPFYFGVEAKIVIEDNFLKRKVNIELAEYISDEGMQKYIGGIYKKRGCMLGYVMQGNPDNIVAKINERIKTHGSPYSPSEILNKTVAIEGYQYFYESNHPSKLEYPLKHLLLDFTGVRGN